METAKESEAEIKMKEIVPEEEKSENGPSKDDTISNTETVVFKTPSFVIPSKNKIQNKKDAAFTFKVPASLASKSLKSTKENLQEKFKEEKMEVEGSPTSLPHDSTSLQKEQTDSLSETSVKSSKISSVPPAEQIRHTQAAIPYQEPPWSEVCEDKYSLEVLKNGSIIDNIDLNTKAFHVVGRLPSCDIPMEHPSLSRYHAVLQYSNGSSESYPKGWYLFDLDSTHGTWVNKNKVPPLKFHQLHVDFCLKFGGSTRLLILQGPDEDRETESELSVKEMVEQREKQKKEAEFLRQAEMEEAQRKVELLKKQEEARGCSWGLNEEEEEEEEESGENPFAITDNEELYIDDPKKSLNGYFEREGLDPPQYEFTEAGFGKWKCSVELPLDTPSGEPMVAEVTQSGKKREAVVACALEACRILDRHGVLRQSTHESKKRKQRNWEEDDYYDSDEDVYLDRTGTIEKKREIRMNKAGKSDKKTDTYESLMEKHKSIMTEMEEIEGKLAHAKAQAAALESEEVDALDAYMTAIKSGMMDTRTKMSLKRRMMELKQEEQKVRKLVNIAKPATLPDIKPTNQKSVTAGSTVTGSIGKMKGIHTGKLAHKPLVTVKAIPENNESSKEDEFKEEVEEEEEEEEVKTDTTNKDNVMTVVESSLSDNKPAVNKDITKKETGTVKEKAHSQEKVTSKPKVRGPTLPLAAVLEKLADDSEVIDDKNSEVNLPLEVSKAKSASVKRKHKTDYQGDKKKKTNVLDYDPNDPEYASWVPPDNQAGDGKTHLNAKYGY